MRKMFPSEALEKVYDEGVWEIASGSNNIVNKRLKDFESDYQYKIYLNVKGSADTLNRSETEIGITNSFIAFLEDKGIDYITLGGNIDGGSNFRVEVRKIGTTSCSVYLKFSGTTSGIIKFRYLITRSKIYW